MAEQLGVDPEDVQITSVETDEKGAVIVTYQVRFNTHPLLPYRFLITNPDFLYFIPLPPPLPLPPLTS